MALVLNLFKQASFIIGVLTLLCALPVIAAILERIRDEGKLDQVAVGELVVVPLIYTVVRYAERQMRQDDRPTRGQKRNASST